MTSLGPIAAVAGQFTEPPELIRRDQLNLPSVLTPALLASMLC